MPRSLENILDSKPVSVFDPSVKTEIVLSLNRQFDTHSLLDGNVVLKVLPIELRLNSENHKNKKSEKLLKLNKYYLNLRRIIFYNSLQIKKNIT